MGGFNRVLAAVGVALLCAAGSAVAQGEPAGAVEIDAAHRAKAREVATKAIAWLRSEQDPATGGWNAPDPSSDNARRQVHLPAFTGLVINAMLLDPDIDTTDQSVRMGVKYLLDHQQDDGGIYDRLLPNYNTSIALSALARASDMDRVPDAIERAAAYLKTLQWTEAPNTGRGDDKAPDSVGKDHPFYGGVGYGNHGRPDNSNLNLMLQAMHDAGLSPADEVYQRAVVFLERTQMLDEVNPMSFADGSKQGGFVYATVPNIESVDDRAGDSEAGMIEETMDDGTVVSRLRAYGSMTYAGFKSYVYADLPRDDLRVTAAYDWIRRNYTVDENPGMGQQGLYYYMVMMARALDAWGGSTIVTTPEGKAATETRNWRHDMIDKLASLQNEDGSFRAVNDRWMENDAVLITAYGLLALEHAAGNDASGE